MGTCSTVKRETVTNPYTLMSISSDLVYNPKSRLHSQTLILNEQFASYQKERWIHLRDHQKLNKSVVLNFEKILLRNSITPKRSNDILNSNNNHSSAIGSESNHDKITGLEERNDENNRKSQVRAKKKSSSIKISPIEENLEEASNKRSSIITGSIQNNKNCKPEIILGRKESEIDKNQVQKSQIIDKGSPSNLLKAGRRISRNKNRKLLSMEKPREKKDELNEETNHFHRWHSESNLKFKKNEKLKVGHANRSSLLI